jgi:hypothetical protein
MGCGSRAGTLAGNGVRRTQVFGSTGGVRRCRHLRDNEHMTGIQFVTGEKGRKAGVLIDLKKHGAIREDFWDGLVSESRRQEKAISYEQYRATRLKRTRPRG